MKAGTLVFVLTFFSGLLFVYSDIISPFAPIKPITSTAVQQKAAFEVLKRVIGSAKAKWFRLEVKTLPEFMFKDGFRFWKKGKESFVYVTAPTGASAVWGAYYYLKKYCNFQVSWDGDNVNLHAKGFPDVYPPEIVLAQDEFRFYQNPRASGYSYVWWDWKRWEREIDWMAFNGINMALAFTAQEAIWDRVHQSFGLKTSDVPGAPFLPWYRLGQLKRFGNGIIPRWHEGQIKLQRKILTRMRELGITPVLPGFCGIVSDALQNVLPLLNGTKQPKWHDFSDDYCCRTFVSPFNPLYAVIAAKYQVEYMMEFGTNHVYSCNPYLQREPMLGEEKYLMALAVAHMAPMLATDPLAVWMVHSAMFNTSFWSKDKNRAKSFLTAIPLKKLIILELEGETEPQFKEFNSFYGHSFIWCTLHGYGGQPGFYGDLEAINKGLMKARYHVPSSMIGIGITPEGINQNYIVYDFVLDSTFRALPADITDWVSNYALRRYGVYDKNMEEAWLILKDTAYKYDESALKRESYDKVEDASLDGEYLSDNILTKRPDLNLTELQWYNKSRIYDVYEKFITAVKLKSKICSFPLFRHDLIDVTRQTIQVTLSTLYFNFTKDYKEKNHESFNIKSLIFLELLDELDNLLGHGINFLFGNWIMQIFSWVSKTDEAKKLSEDSRNLITRWGPEGELRDYAFRQWADVIAEYYKPRWTAYIDALNASLTDNTSYDAEELSKKIYETVEKPFLQTFKSYKKVPRGDPEKMILCFDKRWGSVMYKILRSRTYDDDDDD